MRAAHARGRWWLIAVLASIALAIGPGAGAEPSGDPLRFGPEPVATPWLGPGPWAPELLAQAARSTADDAEDAEIEYDPWEPFNERMFEFNRQVDRYVLKPAAQGWEKVAPVDFRQGIANAVNNLGMPRRFVNSLLQLKFHGALRELTRFVVNSTVGVAGLFDVMTPEGVPASDEDLGQTLGVYGVGPGPYLILPFLPPLTVRDGVGFVGDIFLDPLFYVMGIAERFGARVGTTINDRSLNITLFEQIEADVLDLYGAVRNAYLQRRQRQIRE